MEINLRTPEGVEYIPLPTQGKFHASPAKYRALLGGFGSGKSGSGAVEALLTMLEYPGCPLLISRFTYKELQESTWEIFQKTVPVELIKDVNRTKPSLELKNGSRAVGWNLERHQSMTSLNLGAFWIDECCEDGVGKESFLQLVGRNRSRLGPRRGWLTGNSGGRNWVYDLFFGEGRKPGYEGFRSATTENIHLTQDYITGLRDLYDDEWLAKYFAGSFDIMEGMVFDNFNQGLHVVDPFRVPNEWPRFRGIDHGFTNPTACLWLAADFDGNLFVYRNYYQRCSIPSENTKAIQDLTAGENIDWTVIDPSVKQTESSGERIIDQYRKAGLVAQYGDNDVKSSISRIRQLLQRDETHRFPAQHPDAGEPGSPRLFIARDCRELIWELQQYQWKQIRPGGVNKEIPLAKHDHLIAALRYVVMRSPHAAVEKPALGQYERFKQMVAEFEGKPLDAGETIPLADYIGNEGLR